MTYRHRKIKSNHPLIRCLLPKAEIDVVVKYFYLEENTSGYMEKSVLRLVSRICVPKSCGVKGVSTAFEVYRPLEHTFQDSSLALEILAGDL